MNTASYTLWQLVRYMLKLGTIGFGGPVALVGYMRRDLVDARGWISEADYKEGLALSQLAPGPLAAQLSIYLGFVHYRLLGATLVGLAFVLPSFLMVVALGWAYQHFGGLTWMQAVFYGVGAAVIGIIVMSAKKLTEKSIGRDRLLWAVYLALALVTVVTESEMAWLFLASGVLVWLVRSRPRGATLQGSAVAPWLASLFGAADGGVLFQLGLFFAKAGAFVFGSGLAIVPFLYGGLVTEHHWLTEKQFVDAVAVAMITPGPVVITVGFIGYLIAGLGGAAVAALATFLPCYVITVVAAPYFKRFGKLPGVLAFVDGITAAAIGAISGSVIVIAKRTITDLPTAAIALITIGLLWRFKKLQEPVIVGAAALLGLLMFPLVGHAAAPAQEEAKIVMVCEHGSVKSLIAASLFNREAERRGSPWRAVARGVTPDAAPPAAIVASMRGDGFDVAGFHPQAVAAQDLAKAAQVVTIGEEVHLDSATAKLRQWNDIPAASVDYAAARRALSAHVDALLDQLDAKGGSRP